MENCETCIGKPACVECLREIFELYTENRIEWLADSCRSSEPRSVSSESSSLSGFIVKDESEQEFETPKPIFPSSTFDTPLNLSPIPNASTLIKRKPLFTTFKPDEVAQEQEKQKANRKLAEARNRIKRERKEISRLNDADDHYDEIYSDLKYFNNI